MHNYENQIANNFEEKKGSTLVEIKEIKMLKIKSHFSHQSNNIWFYVLPTKVVNF